jgi:hypothetical protein
MIAIYSDWVDSYPIVSVEDPLSEEDWAGWQAFTAAAGDRVQIVGDDLFVTNPERLRRGIAEKSANALLVKVNQIGTVSETFDAVSMAHRAGFACMIRPGRRDQRRPAQDRRAGPRRARCQVQPAAAHRGAPRRRRGLRGRRGLPEVHRRLI